MLSQLIKINSRGLSVSLSLVLLLTSGALISARRDSSDLKAIEPAAPSQGQRSDAQLEAELVTVTPTGFEPGEITRPQGRFMLAIDNRSGLSEVEMYLERETGGRVNVPLSRKGKLAWRQVIDLPTGNYVLRAVNNESWRCRIKLTPR